MIPPISICEDKFNKKTSETWTIVPLAQLFYVLQFNPELAKFKCQDIKTAIHYLTLAPNNNHRESQYIIGIIYYSGKYINEDINKAINYLTHASNNNFVNAYYALGIIYNDKNNGVYNFEKTIHFLTLAAENNHPEAQYHLGIIYSNQKQHIN